MSKRESAVVDEGLARIDDLERAIVAAHDERVRLGVSAEEVARQRPAVVALAAAVAGRLRDEYLARATSKSK